MKLLLSLIFTLLLVFSASAQDLYDVFSNLPTKSDRKALVKLQTPDVQRALWQKHLSIALSKKDIYTDEQRALIKESKKLLTLEFFRTDKRTWQGTDLEKKYNNLQVRIVKAFKDQPELYQHTFELLGDAGTLIGASCVRDNQMRLIRFTQQRADCNCNYSLGCGWGGICGEQAGGCNQVINCGPFGATQCSFVCGACNNGNCGEPENQ